MRRMQWLGGLAAAVAVLAAGPALAEADASADVAPKHTLKVTNDTGSALTELYIETSGGGWPEDLLSDGIVAPGESVTINFDKDACHYELKAVFLNEIKVERPDIDVCAHPEVRLAGLLAEDTAAANGLEVRTPTSVLGGRGSAYQVQVSPDAAEAEPEPAAEPQSAAPPPPPGRGVPICPGDARCRKKPGG